MNVLILREESPKGETHTKDKRQTEIVRFGPISGQMVRGATKNVPFGTQSSRWDQKNPDRIKKEASKGFLNAKRSGAFGSESAANEQYEATSQRRR